MWYLSPHQQILETAALALLLIPAMRWLSRHAWNVQVPAVPAHTGHGAVDAVFAPARSKGGPLLPMIDFLLTVTAWILMPLTVYYKAQDGRLPYLLQPCHLFNGFLCVLSLNKSSKWAQSLFYFYLCAMYGPLLAIVTPDTTGLHMTGEVAAFWVQVRRRCRHRCRSPVTDNVIGICHADVGAPAPITF